MTHKEIGELINVHSRLNTTPQTLKYLRRKGYSDDTIRESFPYCAKGNAVALDGLLQKVPTKYVHMERNEDI